MIGIGAMEFVMLAGLLGFGLPFPVALPPGPEDPVLHRLATEDCLFYLSWAGRAVPDAASGNATERLLADPEIRRFVQAVWSAIERAAAQGGQGSPQGKALAEHLPTLIATLLSRPTAVVVNGAALPAQIDAAFVCQTGDATDAIRLRLERLQEIFLGEAAQARMLNDSPWYEITIQPGAPTIWWRARGRYLIVASGQQAAEAVLSRGRGQPPKWLARLSAELPLERRGIVQHVNLAGVRGLVAPFAGERGEQVFQALGLHNALALDSVSGFDAVGQRSVMRLKFDGAPAGLLGELHGARLTAGDLTIPRDASFAFAWKISPERVFDAALKLADAAAPGSERAAREGLAELGDQVGIRFREDLLAALDGRILAYDESSDIPLFGWTAVLGVKPDADLSGVEEKALALVRASLPGPPQPDEEGGFRRRVRPSLREQVVGGQKVYYLDLGTESVPFAPAWALTKEGLVLGLFPQSVRAHLAGKATEPTVAAAAGVREALAGEAAVPLILRHDQRQSARILAMAALAGGFAIGAELEREGLVFDATAVPSPASVLAPLERPALTHVRRGEDSLVWDSSSNLPLGMGNSVVWQFMGLAPRAALRSVEPAPQIPPDEAIERVPERPLPMRVPPEQP